MKKQTNSTKIIILVIVLAIALLGYFVIYKKIKNVNDNVAEIIRAKQEIRNYTSNATASSTSKLIDSIISDSDRLKNTILTEGDEIRLISTLEKLASDMGVSQQIAVLGSETQTPQSRPTKIETNTKPAQKLEGSEIELAEFQIKIGTSFDGLLKYLEALESTDLYIKIKAIEISRPGESGEELTFPANGVKATITATTYSTKK